MDNKYVDSPELMSRFIFYNKRLFKGKLLCQHVCWWSRKHKSLGVAVGMPNKKDYIIALNPILKDDNNWKNEILLHEMVHLWQYQIFKLSDGHDEYFERKLQCIYDELENDKKLAETK